MAAPRLSSLAVDPMAIAPLLPPGLELDTWEGMAYLGAVPFKVRGSRLPFLPAIPVVSSFHELNLRTYVHRQGRDPGVWFFSLDAASWLAVWGARTAYKLPYFHASMALRISLERVVSFSSRRIGPRVSHPPYPMCRARVLDLDENLAAPIGVVLQPAQAPIAHYAEEVDVRIYPPSTIRKRASDILPRPAAPGRIQEMPSAAP
jgi:hypothetical protein